MHHHCSRDFQDDHQINIGLKVKLADVRYVETQNAVSEHCIATSLIVPTVLYLPTYLPTYRTYSTDEPVLLDTCIYESNSQLPGQYLFYWMHARNDGPSTIRICS